MTFNHQHNAAYVRQRVINSMTRTLISFSVAVILSSCQEVTRMLHLEGPPHAKMSVSTEIETKHVQSSNEPILPEPPLPTPSPTQKVTNEDTLTSMAGSGQFMNMATPPEYRKVGSTGDYALNFVRADLHEVVKAVLGDILQVNYAIAPNVGGEVTLRTSHPLSADALLPTLEAALRLNNLAIVKNANAYEVVPIQDAPQSAITQPVNVTDAQLGLGFGVQAIPLRYTSAAEMSKIITSLAPGGTILRIDEARNLLVLAGTSPDLESMLETIRLFDVDWMQGMSFGFFRLKFASPSAIQKEMESLLNTGTGSPMNGMIRFIPIERLNSIIAVTPQPQFLEHVRGWVERLDKSGDEGGRRLYVYDVQNGNAENLATLLGNIFSMPTLTQADASTIPETAPVSTPQSRIIADTTNNALVIMSTEAEYQQVLSALKRLDIAPEQVLIKATIAEVTLTDELRFGVQWFFDKNSKGVNYGATLSKGTTGTLAQTFPGFSFLFSSQSVTATIEALSSITNVEIVSTPQVLVVDNQTATLQIGDQVPIATRSSVSTTDPNAPVVNSIQFRDTGVILKVTPRVNANGYITINIEQEVSDVAQTTTSTIDSPTIQQRRITSTVIAYNNQSIALGGLIREKTNNVESGLPVLSKLPFIGALFGQVDDTVTRTELLVILTPQVVHNGNEAKLLTEELKRSMQSLVPVFTPLPKPSPEATQ